MRCSHVLCVWIQPILGLAKMFGTSSSIMLLLFRHLCLIRQWVGTEVTTQLVLAFITSRLDYCNSVLAVLILNLNLWYHIAPNLHQLHWLPISCRIQYKLCSITKSIHAGKWPVFILSLNTNRIQGCVQQNSYLYVTPWLRMRFGEREFSYAGLAASR